MKKLIKMVRRVLEHFSRNHTLGTAAETAFFLLLGFFPLMMFAANVLNGLRLERRNPVFTSIFPAEILDLLEGTSPEHTSFFLLAGSAWAASAGIWALMRGVYFAYTSRRLSSLKARLLAIAFMLGFISVIAGTLALLVFDHRIMLLGSVMVVFVLLFCLLTFIPGLNAYPRRSAAAALLGAAAWITLARGYELYMRHISRYTLLYGSIGAFLGLALWLYCLCVIILVCAEISALKTRNSRR